MKYRVKWAHDPATVEAVDKDEGETENQKTADRIKPAAVIARKGKQQ